MALSTIGTNQIANEVFQANKNLIINGAMEIDQRGAVTGLQDDYGGVDRFAFKGNTAARATVSKHFTSNVPEHGLSSSLEIDVTTADTSIASTDYHYLGYKFEGRDLQHIKKGTSSAESLTLQFWVKSPKTGTHVVQLFDQDNTRHISKSYTVSSANTWEKKILTFAGDTTGAITNDNNYSIQIYWWLLAGSDYTSGTLATSWASFTAANAAVGQVNVLDSTSNNFYLTGVQLEIGDVATPFEHEDTTTTLTKCRRYYQTFHASWYGVAEASGYFTSTSVTYSPPMRANPSLTQLSFSAGGSRYTSSGATSSSIDGTTIYSSPGSAGGNEGWQAKWEAKIEL
tara:strand:- start:244 stop:1269 length:1026 start_codon:yes stop_codon:yes gene_type:complete